MVAVASAVVAVLAVVVVAAVAAVAAAVVAVVMLVHGKISGVSSSDIRTFKMNVVTRVTRENQCSLQECALRSMSSQTGYWSLCFISGRWEAGTKSGVFPLPSTKKRGITLIPENET